MRRRTARPTEICGQELVLTADEEELVRRFYGKDLKKAVDAYVTILDQCERREAPGRNDFKGMMLRVVKNGSIKPG